MTQVGPQAPSAARSFALADDRGTAPLPQRARALGEAATAPSNDVLFSKLTETVRTGRKCVAVIGAGISRPDYPLWSELVSELADACKVRPEDSESDHLLDMAEAARRKAPQTYNQTLRTRFARCNGPAACADLYHLLVRIPFASYITLNFDPVLLDVFDLHQNVTFSEYPWLQDRRHGKREVFYIHGRLDPERRASIEDIVLTRSQFVRAYDPYGSRLHGFLQSTFLDNDVCFLGCNPAEDNLVRLLDGCRRMTDDRFGLRIPNRPQWFALMPGDDAQGPKFSEYGIHLVKYPKVNEQYTGLKEVLEHWAQRRKPELVSAERGSTTEIIA